MRILLRRMGEVAIVGCDKQTWTTCAWLANHIKSQESGTEETEHHDWLVSCDSLGWKPREYWCKGEIPSCHPVPCNLTSKQPETFQPMSFRIWVSCHSATGKAPGFRLFWISSLSSLAPTAATDGEKPWLQFLQLRCKFHMFFLVNIGLGRECWGPMRTQCGEGPKWQESVQEGAEVDCGWIESVHPCSSCEVKVTKISQHADIDESMMFNDAKWLRSRVGKCASQL